MPNPPAFHDFDRPASATAPAAAEGQFRFALRLAPPLMLAQFAALTEADALDLAVELGAADRDESGTVRLRRGATVEPL